MFVRWIATVAALLLACANPQAGAYVRAERMTDLAIQAAHSATAHQGELARNPKTEPPARAKPADLAPGEKAAPSHCHVRQKSLSEQNRASARGVYRYTGEQLDPNLGFYYLRARYMDPGVGRFVTKDAFRGISGIPNSLHKYAYASLDPVNMTDPTGHFSQLAGAAAAIAILATTLLVGDILSTQQGPSGAYYHHYQLLNQICTTTEEQCTSQAVFEALLHYPAPGHDPAVPVRNGELTNIVFLGLSGGTVVHSVSESMFTVINTTLPDHIFRDGYVQRTVEAQGGSLSIRTTGEGSNTSAVRSWLNIKTYRPAFTGLDNKIRAYVVDGFRE